jgi:uncharacterized protein (DUF1697 family)
MAEPYLALLRGVNVGGKNKLPMKELAEIFRAAGCSDVRTYIQSGNVIFKAPVRIAKGLAERVSQAIEKDFGHKPPVVIRSLAELERAVASNPFPGGDDEENKQALMFLADEPAKEHLALLDPQRSPTDEFRPVGREIYLYLRTGFADTKLTNAWFDSKLKTVSTARNWRTVRKLLEMMRQ